MLWHFHRKLWLLKLGKLHSFNSSDGCNDANAQAKENPCIVVQVFWWNNGVLDTVESKTWLAWPTGKLVVNKYYVGVIIVDTLLEGFWIVYNPG